MEGVVQGTGGSFSGAPRFCGWAATFRAAPSCTGRPAQTAAVFSAQVCAHPLPRRHRLRCTWLTGGQHVSAW